MSKPLKHLTRSILTASICGLSLGWALLAFRSGLSAQELTGEKAQQHRSPFQPGSLFTQNGGSERRIERKYGSKEARFCTGGRTVFRYQNRIYLFHRWFWLADGAKAGIGHSLTVADLSLTESSPRASDRCRLDPAGCTEPSGRRAKARGHSQWAYRS
jgi:hypothetical protein